MENSTVHIVTDLRSGQNFALQLGVDGTCERAQALLNKAYAVRPDGVQTLVREFNAAKEADGTLSLPYGRTTYAIEEQKPGKPQHVFTIVWPSREQAVAGAMPAVTKKEAPLDFVRAGFAPGVKTAANENTGSAVDNAEVLAQVTSKIDRLIGLKNAKKEVYQNISIARFNKKKEELGLPVAPISRHMVFTGSPGTGKTTFAREVASIYHALGLIEKPLVVEVKRQDLVAGYVGQTALKTKEAIDKAKGGILFIDEFYSLFRGGAGNGNDFGKEAIDTLVAEMENMRDDLIVIVAGYKEPTKQAIESNEGLKSRFVSYIDFEDYNGLELQQIMHLMLKDRGYTITPDAEMAAMHMIENEKERAGKEFANARVVRNLVELVERELAFRLDQENLLGKAEGVAVEDLKKAFTTITLADVRNVSLDGLNSGASLSSSIGFGGAAKSFNDNLPPVKTPAPAVEQPVVAQKKRANSRKHTL